MTEEEPPDCDALVRTADYRRWYAEDVLQGVFSSPRDRELVHVIFSRFARHEWFLEYCRAHIMRNAHAYYLFRRVYESPIHDALHSCLCDHRIGEEFRDEFIEPALRALYIAKFEQYAGF